MAEGYHFQSGPYLEAALLCEKVLVEVDGVKSIIRVIDRIVRTVIGQNPPPEMEPFNQWCTLFLRIKAGRARGVMPLKIEIIKPSGESLAPLQHSILFEGEDDRGIDVVDNIVLQIDQTGIYWFKIYLNNVKITQVPLRVVYLPQVTQTGNIL